MLYAASMAKNKTQVNSHVILMFKASTCILSVKTDSPFNLTPETYVFTLPDFIKAHMESIILEIELQL